MAVRIRLDGEARLRAKLNGQKFLIEPIGGSLKTLGEYAEREAHLRAPKGATGQTDRAISLRLGAKRPLKYVAVVLKAVTAPDGFRYPFALDAAKKSKRSAKTPPYRYAGTGKSTHNWFRGVGALVKRRMRAAARRAAAGIQKGWGSR